MQLLGSAAWEAAAKDDTDISSTPARRGAAECAIEIEDFYEERYQEAEARRVEPALGPVAALLAESGGPVADSRLKPLLRSLAGGPSLPFDDIALKQELSDLGVLWSPRPGVWEMGIPGFADYLLRRA